MTDEKLICTSCKKRVTNQPGTAKFNCPSCGKTEIVRCKHCREIAAKYTCHSCDFTGPN
ncbi:MAG: zinc finger domain-containing protein [Candidatus Woesearchaeota archaeon]|nr:zinc finger domain-containing protein [Candidatus Woesearchaeota archaeon]MDP7506699.1 zinc finger domain-containing protein [Candidatus Woesearchaeota archaeon]